MTNFLVVPGRAFAGSVNSNMKDLPLMLTGDGVAIGGADSERTCRKQASHNDMI